MTELKPTYGNFSIRGIVVGLNSDRSYTEGSKEGGGDWRKLSFGVKVDDCSIIYVEVMGNKSKELKIVNKKDRTKFTTIPWTKQNEIPSNYRLHMPLRVCINQSEPLEFVSYEAIDYIKANLNDGDSVYINGSLQHQMYQENVQHKFVVQDIGTCVVQTGKDAYFSQEIVFAGMHQNEELSQYVIDGYILYFKNGNIEKLKKSLILKCCMNEESESKYIEEAISIFKDLEFGSTVRVFGDIYFSVPVTFIDNQPVVSGLPVKQFIITGGSTSSIIRKRYTDRDLEQRLDPFHYEPKKTELMPWEL